MLAMDPLTPVKHVLHPMSIMSTEKMLQIRIEEDKRKWLHGDNSLFFQIRAMKLDSKVKYMMKFPDK
jgi:hypothetical protein